MRPSVDHGVLRADLDLPAVRHGLRETRHVTNLALFLLANTGQPMSMQRLTKSLAIPTVGQTSRYLEYLEDAYVLFGLPRFSASFKQRVVTPNKYYAIDNGLRRANSPQTTPDVGHRLEPEQPARDHADGEHREREQQQKLVQQAKSAAAVGWDAMPISTPR